MAENLDNSNMTDPGQLDAETVSDPPEAPPASTESASLPAVPEPEIDGEIENLSKHNMRGMYQVLSFWCRADLTTVKWLYLKDADPIPIRNAIVKLFSLYPHYPQARLELFMSSSHCQKWYCMRDILQHDELYDAREVEDGARRAGGSGCALCKPEASCLQIKPAGAKLAHVDRYNEMYCARLVATRR